MTRPMLHDLLDRPDEWGNHVHRLSLGTWNRTRMAFRDEEFLGEFTAAPGEPVGTWEWVGSHPDAYLHIALPGGRVVEVQSAVLTVGKGPWPARKPPTTKKKKAVAAPIRAQGALKLL